MSSSAMAIATLLLSVSILLSKILGFARDAIIAAYFGASSHTDAYYAAFTLPDLLAYFLTGGALSITFIPLFTHYLTHDKEKEGWQLFSSIACLLGALLVLATLLAEIFAPHAITWLNPGFNQNPETLRLATTMTRIVLPAQCFLFLGGLLNATNYAKKIFWPAALSPIIYNLCIIISGIIGAHFHSILGFPIGVLLGAFLGSFGVPWIAARPHMQFQLRISFSDPGLKKFFYLSLPLVLGVSLVSVDDWFLKYFASLSEQGSITWISNARKMMLVMFAMLAQAASQAALPYLSQLFSENKTQALAQTLTRSISAVLFLSIIAASGLIIASDPIIHIIFQRGQFSYSDAQTTSQFLKLFALALPAWSTQSILARGFYAQQNTLTPMITGTLAVVLSFPIYWYFFHTWHLQGLILASVIALYLNTSLTFLAYHVQQGTLFYSQLLKSFGYALLIGTISALSAWGSQQGMQHWMFTQPLSQFNLLNWLVLSLFMALPFFLVLFLASHLLKLPELDILHRRLFNPLVRRILRKKTPSNPS